MKAYTISKYGKQPLTLSELPGPVPTDTQVLVKINAASVNPIDLKRKHGDLRTIMATEFPLTLGHDFAGEVIQTGSDVHRFKVGDRVFGKLPDNHIGSFAEYVTVEAVNIARTPAELSDVQAAAIPLVGLTAYQALHDYLNVQPGQSVYIPAGSGGLGSLAIPIAAALGAEVTTTASPKSVDRLKALGATTVIDYHQPNFLTQLGTFDAAFDLRGGQELTATFDHVKPGGHIVTVNGFPNRAFLKDQGDYYQLKAPMRFLLKLLSGRLDKKAKQRNIDYRFMLVKSSGAQLAELTDFLTTNHVLPTIDQTFTFDQTQTALDYVASGHATGKVVITQ